MKKFLILVALLAVTVALALSALVRVSENVL